MKTVNDIIALNGTAIPAGSEFDVTENDMDKTYMVIRVKDHGYLEVDADTLILNV